MGMGRDEGRCQTERNDRYLQSGHVIPGRMLHLVKELDSHQIVCKQKCTCKHMTSYA